MTPLQVFLAYAKIRGIMSDIHKIAIDNDKIFWLRDPVDGTYVKKHVTFSYILYNHFVNEGFGHSMFFSLLYQYPYGDILIRKPNVANANKKWTTFVRNNIIYDGNIKVGSRVKYNWWDIDSSGVVEYIEKDFSRIRIRRDDGRHVDHVQPGRISEVDGKPADFSFHIKWKGKEYYSK